MDSYLIAETTSYANPTHLLNMGSNIKEELDTRIRAAWVAFRLSKEANDQITNFKLRAHLFHSTII